ncbi:MAG TPA: radical SAM protein [Blastocatellia bacterium]|nr:radical SAM protein [Blastocatellia bacterium]
MQAQERVLTNEGLTQAIHAAKERAPLNKKLRLVSAYARGNPVWLSWQVTYWCNYHCDFCDYWAERPKGEATLAEIARASKELAKLGSIMISMAGGEPFIRKDLHEITRIIAEDHFPFVTTHGGFIRDEKRITQMWKAGLWGVSVSVDSIHPEKHDEHRGKKGAWDQAIKALKLAMATRTRDFQRVNWQCVLKDDNLDEIEPMIQMAAEIGCYFMVQPLSGLKMNDWSHKVTYKGGVSEHLLKLKKKYKNFKSNPFFLSQFDSFIENDGLDGCRAGKAFINIDNFLSVSRCVETRQEQVGSLKTESIESLLERLHRQQEENTCIKCWYNCRGETESLYNLKGFVASLPTLINQ